MPLTPINLGRLAEWIFKGRIDPAKPITMKTLYDAGCVRKFKFGVKLLGAGVEDFNKLCKAPLQLELSHASETAKQAVESRGGQVKFVWYNSRALRALLKPEKFTVLPRSPGMPPPNKARRIQYANVPSPFAPHEPPTGESKNLPQPDKPKYKVPKLPTVPVAVAAAPANDTAEKGKSAAGGKKESKKGKPAKEAGAGKPNAAA